MPVNHENVSYLSFAFCETIFIIKIVSAPVKISSARRSKIRHKGENDAIKENLRESSVVKSLCREKTCFIVVREKSCLVTFTKLKDSYFQFEQTHVVSVEGKKPNYAFVLYYSAKNGSKYLK